MRNSRNNIYDTDTSASEVTTLWRYTNLFIIIIYYYFFTLGRYIPEGVLKLSYTKLDTDLSARAVRGYYYYYDNLSLIHI